MFETVIPNEPRTPAVLASLPVSMSLHAMAVGVFIIGAVWQVEFPTDAPTPALSQRIYTVAAPTPAPPPPPPPPRSGVAMPAIKHETAITAPNMIPNEVPDLPPGDPQQIASNADGSDDGVEGGIVGGVAGGMFGGLVGGVIGGTIGGILGEDGTAEVVTEVKDWRIEIARDAALPLRPLSRRYPIYPEEARLRRWEDWLVVRYLIGADGRVKDVTIINRPEQKIFEEATIRAIRFWRFYPLMKDGIAHEVSHELTVIFKLHDS